MKKPGFSRLDESVRQTVEAWFLHNNKMTPSLTNLDEQGHAHMVDVGAKPDTHRVAIARGEVHLTPDTLNLILSGGVPKGDVFAAARIAGIMGAKKTSELIPL